MTEYKLLFTGPMGAGKTTAIGAVSEVKPVLTDVQNTDQSVAKERTTVGLDFGLLTLENGDRIRLFGTPGQVRFDFLWKILSQNVLGIVILIDNSKPAPLDDLRVYLDGFAAQLKHVPCVIGVGRTDAHPAPSLDEFSNVLNERGLVLPILGVDVRLRSDVVLLIDCLLAQMEASLFMENKR
ncbi:GTP-binding protein [Lampropedia puyangensis]|uniref:GTP-binding protein n=1 Tax=Lampropedia puyangensis TaxID=1330072 RepID=A0A4S8FB96_9BURK|nr:GTP-binding protein [Lampropedia puyangensis]THU04499.1 GTP-binding protein [Lampropedia puyangensis]